MKIYLGVILVLIGCAFGALTGCQTAEPESPPLQLAILDRDQWDIDVLPKPLQSDLELTTVRLIDRRNNRHYWLAQDMNGDLCLIVGFGIGRPDGTSGRGCADTTEFYANGITVTVSGGNHFSSAVLVPDGYTQSLVATFPGQFVTTNMVAFDSKSAMNGVAGGVSSVVVGSDLGQLPELELRLVR